MKYALIGCGRIATNHVKAVVNNGLEFVAACDLIPEAIETLLAKHGLEKDETIARYTDYKLMLKEHPEITEEIDKLVREKLFAPKTVTPEEQQAIRTTTVENGSIDTIQPAASAGMLKRGIRMAPANFLKAMMLL